MFLIRIKVKVIQKNVKIPWTILCKDLAEQHFWCWMFHLSLCCKALDLKKIGILRGSKCIHVNESLAYKYCRFLIITGTTVILRERIFELSTFCPRKSHTDSVNLSRIWSGVLIGERDINYKWSFQLLFTNAS